MHTHEPEHSALVTFFAHFVSGAATPAVFDKLVGDETEETARGGDGLGASAD
jgi:hypothetical protein